MLVIAHRGASGHRAENTLPAYALAVEMQADMIEIDLHLTRDEEIVVTHDAELDGLGGIGEVGDHTLETIRSLDAGGGERVPTLAEVLDAFGNAIPFNLEIKWGSRGDYPGLEALVLEHLARRNLGPSMLFSSFRPSVLERLRAQAPDARLALLISPRDKVGRLDRAIDRARALGAEALNPHFTQVDAALVSRAHDEGLAVNVYTVDPPELMAKMIALGVDGVFTNLPDRLRRMLFEAGNAGSPKQTQGR
jgi:glycerophosphoryl diester phosphodiesterase